MIHIPFKKEEIPVSKLFEINAQIYEIEIDHNRRANFYTLTIRDTDENTIHTTKLCYATPTDQIPAFFPIDEGGDPRRFDRIDQANFDQIQLVAL